MLSPCRSPGRFVTIYKEIASRRRVWELRIRHYSKLPFLFRPVSQ